jgi:hypothetical protein
MICITFAVLVLVAGYLVYVTRLFKIAFGQVRRSELSRTGLNLAYALTDDREDCDYDLLWDTQLPALESLGSAGNSGVPLKQMTEIYCEFARRYPELCEGSTFPDWIDALQNAEVAVHEGAIITITEKGRFILQGLERTHAVSAT